jgi:hypothetical protein
LTIVLYLRLPIPFIIGIAARLCGGHLSNCSIIPATGKTFYLPPSAQTGPGVQPAFCFKITRGTIPNGRGVKLTPYLPPVPKSLLQTLKYLFLVETELCAELDSARKSVQCCTSDYYKI